MAKRQESKPLGKFKQVHPDTHLGRIVAAAVGGTHTLDEIAAESGRTADQVKVALHRARGHPRDRPHGPRGWQGRN